MTLEGVGLFVESNPKLLGSSALLGYLQVAIILKFSLK